MKHTLHHEKLSSGVRVLFIDVPNSNTFSFNTIVRAGFMYTKPSLFELPHLLEHLAFDGTKSHPTPADFAFALEGEGTFSNASTEPDVIHYFYNGGRTDLENIIDLACSQLVDSVFTEEAIESEKGVVESELSRLLESDGHMCWFVGMNHVQPYLGLPYQDRIGQMAAMSREDIVSYYQSTHTGNNTWIILAGDFKNGKDIASLTTQLDVKLQAIPAGKEHEYHKHDLPANYGSKVIVTGSLRKSEGYFDLGFMNDEFTEDLKTRVAMQIFNTILSGGSASRLFLSTRNKGLSYGPNSSYSFDFDFCVADISDRAIPSKLLPLFKVCVKEAFAIVRGEYSDAELARASGYNRGGFQTGFERPADLARWYSSRFVWGLKLPSPDEFMIEIDKITREDIAAIAQKFYRSDNWVLSVRAPEGSVDEAAYRQVLEDASQG